MRISQYLLSTLREIPHEAEIISHQLMLRSGMIRKLSSGIYIWLPTGIKVLNKVKKIIQNEMKKINALEILTPIIQPEQLWIKSGRLDLYGKELLKFYDRRNNKFILGPTNEEIITHFIGNEISSYKTLPLIVYQIQTKFRDEIRPRFGIIRTREFSMKDAYSFHTHQRCLEQTYEKFYFSYINIFNKIQLKFHIVSADSGSMGGKISHEFQALSQNGEDKIVFSKKTPYSSNINTAQSIEAIKFLQEKNIKIHKKGRSIKSKKHMNDLINPIHNHIKTILVYAKKNKDYLFVALLISSKHELNIFKAEKINIIQKPLTVVQEKEIVSWIGVKQNFLGPIGLNIPIFADISVYNMKNFTIGANIDKHFFINVNWNTDLPIPIFKDIRNVTENDLNPDGTELLKIKNSIEIGHIFQLGKEYSEKMNTSIHKKINHYNQKNLYMGCYGIGITRIVAAIIEQNYDSNGIIWPVSIAPFEVAILPINANKCIKIQEITEMLYNNFQQEKIDVLLDDRNVNPGVMFNDIDLIGIPHQIIISTRYIKENNIEYRERRSKKNMIINIKDVVYFIKNKIKISQ